MVITFRRKGERGYAACCDAVPRVGETVILSGPDPTVPVDYTVTHVSYDWTAGFEHGEIIVDLERPTLPTSG